MSFLLEIKQKVTPSLPADLNANDELSANVEPVLSFEMITLLNTGHYPANMARFDENSLDEHEWAMSN